MVNFDLNPKHRQAVLLQMDDSLNDQEKKIFMKDFLLPIIDEAQKNGLSYEDTNIQVEKAIDANMAPNEQVAKLLKKVAKKRPSIITNIESATGNIFWRIAPGESRMGFQPHTFVRRSVLGSSYVWYQDALKGL
jgi:hypothetical protein